MNMNEKIRIALFASGGGTDADAVMAAYQEDRLMPVCKIVALVSTKTGAGCLEKAAARQIPAGVIDRQAYVSTDRVVHQRRNQEQFEQAVGQWLSENEIQMVFLLGCIHRMPTDCWLNDHSRRVVMLNIHPALPREHGGKGMYGLAVHQHVLETILDQIDRGQAEANGTFFTYPTVHRVTAAYDHGSVLMQVAVPIPPSIIQNASRDLRAAAEKLQQVVLPIEHQMLPTAVNIAARFYLEETEPSMM